MRLAFEIALKAAVGGVLVLSFAIVAQTLTPKRFAGVFAAAPTIAVGSLVITVAFSGSSEARRASVGMVAGALAMIVYCLLAPHVVHRFGALRGSAITLTSWLLVAAFATPAVAVLPAAKAATALAPSGVRRPAHNRRPKIGWEPGKISEVKPRDAMIRFAFGAGTSAGAGLVSDPFVAGTLLAFPAILLASLTLVADEEGEAAARDDATGARAGAIGLLCFAAACAAAFTVLPAALVIVVAMVGWLFASLCAYAIAWASGHGGDGYSGRNTDADGRRVHANS